MSFADLTPEAYKAAGKAARGAVRRFHELSLEYDEVYHEALIYLAEPKRAEFLARCMAEESGIATWRMEMRLKDVLSDRLSREAKRQRKSTSYEEWHDWYTETVDGALVDG